VVIRRATVARAGVPAVLVEDLLTEEQVRSGSPVGRLVTARPWVMDVAVAAVMLVDGLD
jgi:hypothetical protein